MYKELGKKQIYHAMDTYQISFYVDTKTLTLKTAPELPIIEKKKILSNIHYLTHTKELTVYEIETIISFTYYLLNNMLNFQWNKKEKKEILSFLIKILNILKIKKIRDFTPLNNLLFQNNFLSYFDYDPNQIYKNLDQGTLGLLRSEYYKSESKKFSQKF